MSGDVLSYLQGDSHGPKRDMIARCYYEVAQGDPKSGPVAYAVLLDACAEQFAKTPGELRQVTVEFKKIVSEAKQLERGFMDKVDKSNSAVIIAFREETHRAHDAWTETFHYAQDSIDSAVKLARTIMPVIATAEGLEVDLRLLRNDLKQHRERVDAIRSIQADSLALVKSLTRQSQTNRVTIGVLAGMMAYGFGEQALPPDSPFWFRMLILVIGIGVLQWLTNTAWNAIKDSSKAK